MTFPVTNSTCSQKIEQKPEITPSEAFAQAIEKINVACMVPVLNNYEDPASYYFIRDWSPERILDYAAKVGHLKLTESLLKRKISPNIRSYTSQRTPLHEACISGFNKEVVGTLLKYGARRSAISKDGTPLQCVESCLRALEAMPGANEVTALKMRKLEAIRALLQEKTASIYSFAIPKLYDK